MYHPLYPVKSRRHIRGGGLLAIVLVLLAVVISGVDPASGATPTKANAMCGERSAIIQTLLEDFEENPASKGLSANGAVIELFTSTTGSWTILMTRPDGVACLVATGDHWRQTPRLVGDNVT